MLRKKKKKLTLPHPPHRTEDFCFYLRKLELHYCKKKSAKTLCKAGQTLKSPVYLKQAYFASVSHILHLQFWHAFSTNSLFLDNKHYHLLWVGPNEAGSSVEMDKFSQYLPTPSQGPGKWCFHLQYRKPSLVFP